jgi:hypothetical protein
MREKEREREERENRHVEKKGGRKRAQLKCMGVIGQCNNAHTERDRHVSYFSNLHSFMEKVEPGMLAMYIVVMQKYIIGRMHGV